MPDGDVASQNATAARSESSAEYVVRQIARHRRALAVAAAALALMTAGAWWAISRRSSPGRDTPSVVVLPFVTIGSGDGYFADGITEAVTTELGKVAGLRVIASNTAFGYRDRTAVRDIARELGVGLIVRGAVQRAGGAVRIDVSLVDPRDETALWSDHYNRDVTDVLAVQEDISRQIAATLSRTVAAGPSAKSPAPASKVPEAIEAYLRGLWHLKGRSSATAIVKARVEPRRLAVQELRRAVDLDPEFALARAALASAYTQQLFYDATEEDVEAKALAEIHAALRIDPGLAEAYLARAQLTWTARNKFPHERALDDLQGGDIDQSKPFGRIYRAGEGLLPYRAHREGGRGEPAAAASRPGTGTVRPTGHFVRWLTRRNSTKCGSSWNAKAIWGRTRAEMRSRPWGSSKRPRRSSPSRPLRSPGAPDYDVGAFALLAVVYAQLGRREEAQRMIVAAIPEAENRSVLSHVHHAQFHIGAAFGLLGRHDEAVRWLKRAADEGYPSYPRFSTDQSLAPLKGHAEFEALRTRLHDDWQKWKQQF